MLGNYNSVYFSTGHSAGATAFNYYSTIFVNRLIHSTAAPQPEDIVSAGLRLRFIHHLIQNLTNLSQTL